MKKKFLDYSMNLIKEKNNYSDIKLAELKYGLEAFYMLATKLLVIFVLAIVLGLFKELMLFMFFYTPLRGLGFGFHANSSIECWIISLPTFIIIPFLAKTLSIPIYIIHIIILFSVISFLFFAPADSHKKPLVNTKKRLINKSILVIISLIYLFLTIIIKNELIINTLMFASLWQAICVNPLIYKLFNQPFNNYKTYLKEV